MNTDHEDVRLLLEELAEIKEILRESSRQLLRVERRAKAAFPAVASMSVGKPGRSKGLHLDEQDAGRLISDLKEKVSKGEQIEHRLRGYSVKPDLQIVARILGITNTKLPPKDELVRRISTRLRQSVSVTSGFHDDTESNKNEPVTAMRKNA